MYTVWSVGESVKKDLVVNPSEPHAALEYLARFGLTEFRPGQMDVIQAVLDQHDCLCIMPTGGGKSLCYQLPSIMRKGITLVVSPLIALMKDQVDSLVKMGIDASFINSTLSATEQNDRLIGMEQGKYDLLYIAPERFRSSRFLEAVNKSQVQLLAVDEAHCISEWGHDFRHDYTRIGQFRQKIGNPQTIALTATATKDVQDDVSLQLNLQSPKTFVAGFARPNLHYAVNTFSTKREKMDAVVRFVTQHTEGAGIIYASTRKGCEEIAEQLAEEVGRRVLVYHAGLQADNRRKVQELFMQEEAPIVVATNAFGMGIDKANVRFVVHYNIPGSLEAYYQEAGRAGRDGKESDCLMLYAPSDRYIQEFFIDNAHPTPETIKNVYEFLRHHEDNPIELTQDDLKEELGLSIGTEGVGTCERLLEKAGILERLEPNRNMAAIRFDTDTPTVLDLLPRNAQTQRTVARALEQMVGSRRFQLVYFHIADLATRLDMSSNAVIRALRELNQRESIDYIPPFRGRAVRMIRRDLSFEELNLDLAELEARRKANKEKLNRVVSFSTTKRCRQQTLLDYFGDRSSLACNHCDNCDSGKSDAVPVSKGLERAVLICLSGVARVKKRFGRQVIIQMLCGSNSQKVRKANLSNLSTFGLMKGFKQADIATLFEAIESAELIEKTETNRFRPVLTLSDFGCQVMRQEQPVPPISLPANLTRRFSTFVADSDVEPDSPGVISKKNDLDDEDHADFAEANDLRADSAHHPQSKGPVIETNRAMIQSESAPEYYWTWRLLHDGYDYEQCLAIRRIDEETLYDHLIRAADENETVRLEWCFDDRQISQIECQIDELDPNDVRGFVKRLTGSFTYQQVLLYLKCRDRRLESQTPAAKRL